jgi:hypothetical protein
MVECAVGHDAVPMIWTGEHSFRNHFECPTCGRRVSVSTSGGGLEEERLGRFDPVSGDARMEAQLSAQRAQQAQEDLLLQVEERRRADEERRWWESLSPEQRERIRREREEQRREDERRMEADRRRRIEERTTSLRRLRQEARESAATILQLRHRLRAAAVPASLVVLGWVSLWARRYGQICFTSAPPYVTHSKFLDGLIALLALTGGSALVYLLCFALAGWLGGYRAYWEHRQAMRQRFEEMDEIRPPSGENVSAEEDEGLVDARRLAAGPNPLNRARKWLAAVCSTAVVLLVWSSIAFARWSAVRGPSHPQGLAEAVKGTGLGWAIVLLVLLAAGIGLVCWVIGLVWDKCRWDWEW